MKQIDFTGWREIFSFTFHQTIQAKAYLITLAVFCAIAAIGIPVYGYLGQGTVSEGEEWESMGESLEGMEESWEGEWTDTGMVSMAHLKTIYLVYEKEESLDALFSEMKAQYDCDVEVLPVGQLEEQKEHIKNQSDCCILVIQKEQGIYSVERITGWDYRDILGEMDLFSYDLSERLEELQRTSVIPDDALEDMGKGVSIVLDGEKPEEEDAGMMDRYMLWLFASCITIFLVSFAGQNVANSIIVEKSSKLIEYLMISVRPMAIVAGKVTAILASVWIQVGAMLLTGVLSCFFSEQVLGISVMQSVSNVWQQMGEQGIVLGWSVGMVVLAVLILCLGLLFFSLLASIAGAAVSKIEETAEGMMMFNMLVIIGGYLSIALAIMVMIQGNRELSGVFAWFCCLFPVTSVFTVPVNLFMGGIPVWVGILAVLFLLVGIGLVFVITTKVYEYLLFYNGVTLKFKDILYLARHGKLKEDA